MQSKKQNLLPCARRLHLFPTRSMRQRVLDFDAALAEDDEQADEAENDSAGHSPSSIDPIEPIAAPIEAVPLLDQPLPAEQQQEQQESPQQPSARTAASSLPPRIPVSVSYAPTASPRRVALRDVSNAVAAPSAISSSTAKKQFTVSTQTKASLPVVRPRSAIQIGVKAASMMPTPLQRAQTILARAPAVPAALPPALVPSIAPFIAAPLASSDLELDDGPTIRVASLLHLTAHAMPLDAPIHA